MFDKELENKYIFNTRVLAAKEYLKKWHPDNYDKFIKQLSEYHLAVLGSISKDVITKTGLDTYEQIVELINQYASDKILKNNSKEDKKKKGLVLIKNWNPDNYHDLLDYIDDDELIKLSEVNKDIISTYGLNTVMDIKTCIKKNETSKISNFNVDFYNGNYNEFLYNTFISFRKIHDNKIDTDINVKDFDYEFFGGLMENLIKTYIKYHKK
jgi:hypothetical protein